MDIMKMLQPSEQLFVEGKHGEALSELEALWERLPAPQPETKNSYSLVSCGAIIALKVGDLDSALKWANRGLEYSGNFNLAGESEFLAGEVAYAMSDLDKASGYFSKVKKLSGKRLFKGKNPEYEKLAY
jgi:tetratricopeptide (TPR) repeat protein